MATSDISQIKPTNIPDAVAAALRARIAGGDWTAGARMPGNRELAAQFGVSMGSVREALSKLIAEGLIESRAGQGTFVARVRQESQPTLADIRPVRRDTRMLERAQVEELLEAREILESQIVQLAARRATEEQIARLKSIVERMSAGAHEPARYSEADVEFHLALAEAAHNRVLLDAMTSIRTMLRRDMELSAEVGARRHGDLHFSVDSHRRIVEAIEAHDPGAAKREIEEVMGRHHGFVLGLYQQLSPDGSAQ